METISSESNEALSSLIACSKSSGVPYFGSASPRAWDARERVPKALKEYPISPLAIEPMTIGDQERGLPMGTLELELCGRVKANVCRMDLEQAKFLAKVVEDRSRWKQLENI
jgi:hypothetical protein